MRSEDRCVVDYHQMWQQFNVVKENVHVISDLRQYYPVEISALCVDRNLKSIKPKSINLCVCREVLIYSYIVKPGCVFRLICNK